MHGEICNQGLPGSRFPPNRVHQINPQFPILMRVFWYATCPGWQRTEAVINEKIRHQRGYHGTYGVSFILGASWSRWYMALLAKRTSFRDRFMTLFGRGKYVFSIRFFSFIWQFRQFHLTDVFLSGGVKVGKRKAVLFHDPVQDDIQGWAVLGSVNHIHYISSSYMKLESNWPITAVQIFKSFLYYRL